MYGTINSFSEICCLEAEREFSRQIKEEIEKKEKEYILGVDENEYQSYLIEKHKLEPLKIYTESETIDTPRVSKEAVGHRHGYTDWRELYLFRVKYSYTGSSLLFRVKPNPWTMTSAEVVVTDDTVSFSVRLYNKDADEFKREKASKFSNAFTNLDNVNKFVEEWNRKLSNLVNTYFQQQKKKYLEENSFFEAINVKVNEDTKSVFTVPVIKKKVVPQPTVASNKELSSVPTISNAMYEDILKIIYELGKSMEKKPSLYKSKNEESLRDHFLSFLETRYDATTATGETFNRNGKTDILLKYANDSSNLFVAECKFWKGAVELQKAIVQLLGYLTWRDSKTALILFVQNNNFSNVLQTIKEGVRFACIRTFRTLEADKFYPPVLLPKAQVAFCLCLISTLIVI